MVYCFAHELVRRALYDRLTAPRRAELHLRAGEAIEAREPAARRRTLADLAHHFTAAAPLGGTERAVDYNLRAAAAATAALAFDEAVAALRTALGLGIPDARDRAEIQLALGGPPIRGGPARTRSSRIAPRPTSPATSATASCSPGPRSGSRTPAGGWPPTGARSSC